MIAHKAKDRRDMRSSAKSLIRYIHDSKNNGAKVAASWTRNLMAGDDLDLAIKELQAVQELNTRAKSDKTYHLIISFRESDKPTTEQMQEIEAQYSAALGYGTHQRVCTVHNDTDNTHIHVAINKIDPNTFSIREPYRDFYILDEVSRAVEKKYHFEVDNRIDPEKTTNYRGIADDIVAHRGEEPFAKWCREEVSDEITQIIETSTSWHLLHESLAKSLGLTIKKRGAGLVISDESSGATCTVSSIKRGLGIKNLEKKLGKYQVAASVERGDYSTGTVTNTVRRNELYKDFLAERKENYSNKLDAIRTLRKLRDQKVSQIKREYRDKRASIRSGSDLDWRRKKALCSIAQTSKLRAIEETRREFGLEIDRLKKRQKITTWRDFLLEKSRAGDLAALKSLQTMKKVQPTRADTIEPDEKASDAIKFVLLVGLEYAIRPSGDVVYTLGKGTRLVDRGSRIDVFANSETEILKALKLAQNKFGRSLRLSGSAAFMEKAQRLAIHNNIRVLYRDPTNLGERRPEPR